MSIISQFISNNTCTKGIKVVDKIGHQLLNRQTVMGPCAQSLEEWWLHKGFKSLKLIVIFNMYARIVSSKWFVLCLE